MRMIRNRDNTRLFQSGIRPYIRLRYQVIRVRPLFDIDTRWGPGRYSRMQHPGR